jgi:SP family sugar:H+ symporter-like MFS transporter
MKRLSAYLPHNRFDADQSRTSHSSDLTDREKQDGYTDSPVPFVTWRSLALGAFVSIGGIIFGYDTGQISGFLEMENFQRRFGQLQDDGSYKFSNVRSGLIVSMVCKLSWPCIIPILILL